MKPLPTAEFRVADANAAYRGASLAALMDNAGKAVAREVSRRVKGAHPHAVVFCGKGNNGGDGYVAARELSGRFRVTVVLAEGRAAVDPQGVSAGPLKQVERDRAITRVEWSPSARRAVEADARTADVLVDCLLGSGISGPPRAPYDGLIAMVNRHETFTVSVDVPSGFPFKPAVRPDLTVTIEAPKTGMTRANSGTIVPVAIGFPPKAWTHTGPGELLLVPAVADEATKRDRGVLAVVAGGPYSGAPALVALAAHAAGIGLVHVYTPANVANVVRLFDPTLVVHPLFGDSLELDQAESIASDLSRRRCAALAIGPGLGRAPGTVKAVRELVRRVRVPTVVDADALVALRAESGPLRHAVLTPHAGEFKALTGRPPPPESEMDARARAAREAARARSCTMLLKGHVSVVTDGRRVKLNDAGVSAMAVGGAGDVLTGIVGALLAKGLSPFDAARVGAFVAGKAGEIAFADLGHSLKPTDLIACVPRVFSRYVPWWGGKP